MTATKKPEDVLATQQKFKKMLSYYGKSYEPEPVDPAEASKKKANQK